MIIFKQKTANCSSREKRIKKTTANYSVQFLNGFWIFLNWGYKHFSYNFLLHKKYLSEHNSNAGREWENTTTAAHIITVEPGEIYRKQQKPLTLYGIGLINQIMDFTLFLSSSLSFLSFFLDFLETVLKFKKILSRVLSP